MHAMTSKGSKERNTIYRITNFDDIGKVSVSPLTGLMTSSQKSSKYTFAFLWLTVSTKS